MPSTTPTTATTVVIGEKNRGDFLGGERDHHEQAAGPKRSSKIFCGGKRWQGENDRDDAGRRTPRHMLSGLTFEQESMRRERMISLVVPEIVFGRCGFHADH